MSKIEVDKIDPQSGTDLELGTSGDTITIPAGVTFDSSAATNTLPATVVTTDGTQTLTNKSIATTQLTGTITPSDSTVTLAKLTATGTKDATTFLRGDNTFAAAGLNGWSEDGANNNLLPASASAGIYLGVSRRFCNSIKLIRRLRRRNWTPTVDVTLAQVYILESVDNIHKNSGRAARCWSRFCKHSCFSGTTQLEILEVTGLPFKSIKCF